MPVTVYKSTDASAPVLNGQAGSLITVLDAILVNGYVGKTAAGWTKPFSGTNLAAYKPGAGSQEYLRVDDTGSGAYAAGREAFLRGYEAMTAISTGTGPFPTTAQLTNGCFFHKSPTADTTAIPWIAVADSRTLYFFVYTGLYAGYSAFVFGDFYSVKGVSDSYRTVLICRTIQETTGSSTAQFYIPTAGNEMLEQLCGVQTYLAGHYTPRTWDGLQTATLLGKHGNAAHSASILAGLMSYPNNYDNAVYLSQVWLHESATTPIIRGRLRGFWHFLHPVGVKINDGDTWSGTGALAGKTFMAIKPTSMGNGIYVMETSDTWETN